MYVYYMSMAYLRVRQPISSALSREGLGGGRLHSVRLRKYSTVLPSRILATYLLYNCWP